MMPRKGTGRTRSEPHPALGKSNLYPRKIQRAGKSFMLRLPEEWIRTHELMPGDTIHLEYSDDGSLIIHHDGEKEQTHAGEVIIKWKKKDGFSYLANEVMRAYIHGNEVIILEKNKNSRWPDELFVMVELLPGTIIMTNEQNRLVLQCLIDVPSDEVKRVLSTIGNTFRKVCSHLCADCPSTAKSDIMTLLAMLNEAERLSLMLLRAIMTNSKIYRKQQETLILLLVLREICYPIRSSFELITGIPSCNCWFICRKGWSEVLTSLERLFSDQRLNPITEVDNTESWALAFHEHILTHPYNERKRLIMLYDSAYRCINILNTAMGWIRFLEFRNIGISPQALK